MEIGILTFHMAHNCGAMLQANALCKYLNSYFNCNCEIIDYRLPEIYQKYQRLLQSNSISPRTLKMESYLNSLKLSNAINSFDDIKKYDVYIIGSDQVWNANITKGYKDIYFGKMLPKKSYCITYAASAGCHLENSLEFVSRLTNIDKISVRELWLKNELQSHYDKPIAWCLDPVLMVDKIIWDNHGKINDNIAPYILIYSFELTDSEYQMIDIFALQNGLLPVELYTHSRNQNNRILCSENYGPEEWVAYVRNATCVYTDSYHGVLFSIVYKKPFFYLTHGNSIDERSRDVIERLAIKKYSNGFYCISEKTSLKLQEGRMESKNYLEEALHII